MIRDLGEGALNPMQDSSGVNLEFDFTLPLFDPAQIPSTTSHGRRGSGSTVARGPVVKRAGIEKEGLSEEESDSDGPDESWKNDATAWLNRARAKTAKSSRKSREKRRKEEDTVYEENKR